MSFQVTPWGPFEPAAKYDAVRSRSRQMRSYRHPIKVFRAANLGPVFVQAFGLVPWDGGGTDIDVSDAFARLAFVGYGKTLGLPDEFELPEGVVVFPTIADNGVPKIMARCPDEATAAFLVLAL